MGSDGLYLKLHLNCVYHNIYLRLIKNSLFHKRINYFYKCHKIFKYMRMPQAHVDHALVKEVEVFRIFTMNIIQK